MCAVRQRHGLLAAGRFLGQDLDVGVQAQEQAQALAHHGVVISYEEADRHRAPFDVARYPAGGQLAATPMPLRQVTPGLLRFGSCGSRPLTSHDVRCREQW